MTTSTSLAIFWPRSTGAIQDRTDDEMRALADQALDKLLKLVTA